MKRLTIICMMLTAGACVPKTPDAEYFKNPESGGIKQASFEMDCPAEQLQVVDLGQQTLSVGVTGCGKKAGYKWVYGTGWVNNTLSPAASSKP